MYVGKVLGRSNDVLMPVGTWVLYADGVPLAVEARDKVVYSKPVRGITRRYLRKWMTDMKRVFPGRFRRVRYISAAELTNLIWQQVRE